MKRWLIRIVLVLAVIEIAYLAGANTVLNLPGTQAYLNQLRPERFVATWDRAWTWYPFRIHVTGLAANGQGWSQQWQATAPAASASLAPLPLLWKTVHIRNVDSSQVDVRFRPRPQPDRDDKDLRQFYPSIAGRDPDSPAEAPPEPEPGWKVVVDVDELSGENSFWVAGIKGTLVGEGRFTIVRQLRHGPLTVAGGEADFSVKALEIDGQPIADSGSAKGTFAFAPFVPQDNRGLKKLAFFSLDADIDLPVKGLDFLNYYLSRTTNMTLGGEGALNGHVSYDKGNLTTGTDLTIAAMGLSVAEPPYLVDGAGKVRIAVTPEAPELVNATFRFDKLGAFRDPDRQELFAGNDLEVVVERTARILPGANDDNKGRRVAIDIPSVTIPDMAVYQRYLPRKWQVRIVGGTGSLEGHAEMSEDSLDADLVLRSQDAEVAFRENSFETDLSVTVKASGKASDGKAEVDFSGTTVNLDDSRVKNGNGGSATPDPWQTHLAISLGKAEIALPEASDSGPGGFWELSRDRDFRAVLASLDGRLEADLSISDLNWTNVFFKNPYDFALRNGAEIAANVTVSSGWLAAGSSLKMQPQTFRLDLLDYVAEGNGGFDITVDKGGEHPDFRLDANLADASLRLQDEKEAVVDEMTLALTANAKGVSLKDGSRVTTLDLDIPSAKITDMSAYNAYLPKGSPLRITGGTADLTAKLNLDPDTTGGFVKARAPTVSASMDGAPISGAVALDVTIKGGTPKDKIFNISGSSLTIDRVKFAGATEGNWKGRVDLGKASVVWQKPAKLDVEAAVTMTDTRPLVAIFAAHRKSHHWLEKILTLRDVRGNATIKVEPNAFVVPYAFARSDTIDIGAKGVIRENDREGMFYARYGKLAGILEIDNDRRKFGLIGATRKFKEYAPGGKLPGLTGSTSRSPSTKNPLSIFRRN